MDATRAPKIPPMPDGGDPTIEAYKKHVDRTLLRENLKLTPEQRVRKLMAFVRFLSELRRAGRHLRGH